VPSLDFSPGENGYAQVIVYTDASPAAVAKNIALAPQP
jgi:hypothetical protein